MAKNKRWSAAAKFKIALQAAKGDCTINDLCKKYEVAPNQVYTWKKQLLADGQLIFGKNTVQTSQKVLDEKRQQESQLYEKIGQLTIERDFLKKSWDKLHENLDKD